MSGLDLLATNFLSPIVLSFVLGGIAGFLRSDLELPDAVLKMLSIIRKRRVGTLLPSRALNVVGRL
jgi:hypothetical protein